MNDKSDDKLPAEMAKILLHLLRAKEAEVIVETLAQYNELMNKVNERVLQAKRNYDELTRQIKEFEDDNGPKFN